MCLCAALFSSIAAAQSPTDGTVTAGTATIGQNAGQTIVTQTTERAIIDWRSFNVGSDHAVTFAQPGKTSATLNRVQSFDASVIQGRITAPGTVVIQNTAGVLFSGGAVIDAGGLVATSQMVAPDRFMATGNLQISGGEQPSARVSNAGKLAIRDAGLAALVGSNVQNTGEIIAYMGTVALASGDKTTIDFAGDGMFHIAVSGDPAGGRTANSGTIDAAGGRVLITAGGAADIMDTVINTSGIVRATSGARAGGQIQLLGRGGGQVRIAGTLEAQGAGDGGAIRITGDRVDVQSTASIDARGNASGGEIFIGGGLQGSGTMRRAQNVVLHTGSTVRADGLAGKGGTVVVWADQATWFDGVITASGSKGGGFVETSGKVNLGTGDAAWVSAGEGGTWLLDPRNVLIVGRTGATAAPGVNDPTPGAGDFRIVARSITDALNRDENVTITTAQPTSTDAGDITVASALRWNGAGNLTLDADNAIFVNSAIRTDGAGDVTLNAGGIVDMNSSVQTRGSGDILMDAGGDIFLDRALSSTSDGNVTAISGGSIFVNRAGQVTGAGDMLLQAAGDIVLNQRLRTTQTGDLTLTAGNDVTLNNHVFATRDGNVAIRANGGDIRLGGSAFNQRISTNRGNLVLDAPSGSVRIARTNTSQRNTQVFSNAGDIDITAGVEILVQGGEANRQFARIGRSGFSSDITLTAPTVSVIAGDAVRQGSAQIIAGRGGSLSIQADRVDVENGDTGAVARILALNGSSLDINAATQRWEGQVRGTGDTTLNGTIVASVTPRFALASGSNFALNTANPTGSYSADVPLVVTTTDGTISVGAPTAARQVTLRSDTEVALSSSAAITGTGPGNAIVISAGPRFENSAGADVLQTTDASARWLLYMDEFASLVGAAPTSGTFDLYNRPFATNNPRSLRRFSGNRIVYGEQPDLLIAALDGTKTYGEDITGTLALTFAGFRPGDSEATALIAPADAASAGAAGAAPVVGSPYLISVSARASNQGYNVITTDGTLTILPAALRISADDVSRAVGDANPAFTATTTGFVLGETLADLTGTLALATTATATSPDGFFAITPSGVTSSNYAISLIDGTLTVGAPFAVGGTASDQINGGALDQRAGSLRASALTPGDAAFRTTERDIGLATADPFALTYSLGEVQTFQPASGTDGEGFVPASGGLPEDDSEGFEPAAGGLEDTSETAEATCGVAVNLGGAGRDGCVSVTVTETFWEQR